MEKRAQEKEYYKTAVALFFALVIGVFVCLGTYKMTGNIVSDLDSGTTSIYLFGAIILTAGYFAWMIFRLRKLSFLAKKGK